MNEAPNDQRDGDDPFGADRNHTYSFKQQGLPFGDHPLPLAEYHVMALQTPTLPDRRHA